VAEKSTRKQNMKNLAKILIPILVLAGVSAIILTKNFSSAPQQIQKTENKESKNDSSNQSLPMLIDLGRGTCKACKLMLPILQDLQEEYKGRAIIKIVDIRYDPEPARVYNIRLIPTQIFFDATGKEVYRHEGFMDKISIEQKLKEIGVK
jgi:thioredoxin 1